MKLQKEFEEFEENISVSSSKKDTLRKGRNSIREKVRKELKDKEKKSPKFSMQGSFAMNTMIREENSKYDIDDGVYISDYEDEEKESWPVPSTVHNWIVNAVENQTSKKPIDKNTCVRVDYEADYHIDIPIYIVKDDIAYLAHKSKGWIVSDPKSFKEWYKEKNKDTNNQLRRTIKYLKKWKEYKKIDFKGIEITILASNNYSNIDGNDLKSILATVSNIIIELDSEFVCYRPVEPTDEDLFEDISDYRKNNILDGLKNLETKLEKALNEDSYKEASKILQKVFGDEFPEAEDIEISSFVKESKPFTVKSGNDEYA